jgi:hypothetical protein
VARALIAVGAALVLFLAGLGAAVYFTRDEDNIAVDSLLADDITRAIALSEQRSDGRVDLRQYARFEWDEVLIVARDTPAATISERLGYPWTGDVPSRTGELLIFLRDGQIARFADYHGLGRFRGFELPIATVPRNRAVLQVRDLVVSPVAAASGLLGASARAGAGLGLALVLVRPLVAEALARPVVLRQ